MSIWFVPRDAAARSLGADAVASALEARGETVIRNGSRGMLWMEPLVERADDRHGPRVGWSNVSAGQIDAGLPDEQSDNFIGRWKRSTTSPSRTAGYTSGWALPTRATLRTTWPTVALPASKTPSS